MESRLKELDDGLVGDGYAQASFAEFKRVNGLVNEIHRLLLVSKKGNETVWFVDGVEFKRFTSKPKEVEVEVAQPLVYEFPENAVFLGDPAVPVPVKKGKPGRKPKGA